MKIIVLIKQVPDTWGERKLAPSGRLDRAASDAVVDEIDERALEVALTYGDDHAAEIVVLTMGPAPATDILRKALAMGADSAVHIQDDALSGSDLGRTAKTIAAAVGREGFDLVIAGNESTDGRGGMVPAMLAEHLGIPHLTAMDSIELTDSAVSGERGTDDGILAIHAPLPAVISITERMPEARFPSFKGIMRAKKKPLAVWTLADLGIDPGFPGLARSNVLSATERPARTAGKKILDDGNAADELADFLTDRRLI